MFLSALAAGSFAQAQPNLPPPLKNIHDLSLRIEKLTEDGEKCLLDQTSLAQLVRDNVAKTPLHLTDGNYPILYVQVNTAAASELCYSSINMNIHYYSKVPHPGNPEGSIAQIVLWNDTYLVSSEKQAHSKYVGDQIAAGIEFLMNDWGKQNPASLSALPAPAPQNPVANPAIPQ